MGHVPELYPNRASPKLPNAHVAYNNGAPLMGYLALTPLGFSFFSIQLCCPVTRAATDWERSLREPLRCTAAEALLSVMFAGREVARKSIVCCDCGRRRSLEYLLLEPGVWGACYTPGSSIWTGIVRHNKPSKTVSIRTCDMHDMNKLNLDLGRHLSPEPQATTLHQSLVAYVRFRRKVDAESCCSLPKHDSRGGMKTILLLLPAKARSYCGEPALWCFPSLLQVEPRGSSL